MHGQHLECYSCGGVAAVCAGEPFDFLLEREAWPAVPCSVTEGCEGVLVPEALN
jgi:hypothetical protein